MEGGGECAGQVWGVVRPAEAGDEKEEKMVRRVEGGRGRDGDAVAERGRSVLLTGGRRVEWGRDGDAVAERSRSVLVTGHRADRPVAMSDG